MADGQRRRAAVEAVEAVRGPELRLRLRLTVALALAVAGAGGGGADFASSCPPPCECKWQSGNKAAACAGAGLEAVPERLSDDIQNLELSDNPLRRLPPEAFRRAGLANLKKLVLRDCRLEIVHRAAFAGLRIMIELDLSRNRLRSLHADTFRETERLRWLNLVGNLLAALDAGLFRDLPYLQRVEASDNRIARVAVGCFASLPRLHTLRLDGNRLATLRPEALRSLARLASLDLHGNPWRCDCNLQPFRDWVLERNLYTPPTACAEPPRLAGRLWSELDSASLACRPTILEPPPRATLRALTENVTLACKVVGNPAPDVVWLFDSRPLDERRHVRSDGAVDLIRWVNVTIVRVRASDRGGYTCVAENAGGRDERNVTLVLPRIPGGGGGGGLLGGEIGEDAAAVALGCACAAALVAGAVSVAWCRAPRRRAAAAAARSKRLLKADAPSPGADALEEVGAESTKRPASPAGKPPRRPDAPPPPLPCAPAAAASGATGVSDFDRTLLHADVDTFRAPPTESSELDEWPPDLLTFPPRLAPSPAPGSPCAGAGPGSPELRRRLLALRAAASAGAAALQRARRERDALAAVAPLAWRRPPAACGSDFDEPFADVAVGEKATQV